MYLSLSAPLYTTDYILFADIGEKITGEIGVGPLLCYTDNSQCCNSTDNIMGDWYLPGGMKVRDESDNEDFYVTRGPSVVQLHRRNNATSPVGMFCCDVPDARLISRRSCIDISRLIIIYENDFHD